MKNILFVSRDVKTCGVHSYGKMTADILSRSLTYRFIYVEVDNNNTLNTIIRSIPHAAIILNYHPMTMPWLNNDVIAKISSPLAALAHDDNCHLSAIKWHISIDPSLQEAIGTLAISRPVPEYVCTMPTPTETTIGSFGFALRDYTSLINLINEQFDKAIIRLHIPFAVFGDGDGRLATMQADSCRRLVKSGVRLEITHEFMDQPAMLDWLAGNTLNAFIYNIGYGAGPASTTDLAMAVPRPIAINRSWRFRHLQYLPRVEDYSLEDIISMGCKSPPWTEHTLIRDYERIVDTMIA